MSRRAEEALLTANENCVPTPPRSLFLSAFAYIICIIMKDLYDFFLGGIQWTRRQRVFAQKHTFVRDVERAVEEFWIR